jgi:hypothetical protein
VSFPRLQVPRPPQNTKPAAGSRPPAKPHGFVKPAAVPASERSGGIGRVTSHVLAPGRKAPAPAVVIKYDLHGRPTLTPDDIPWNW